MSSSPRKATFRTAITDEASHCSPFHLKFSTGSSLAELMLLLTRDKPKAKIKLTEALERIYLQPKKVTVIRYSVQPRSMVSPLPVPGKEVKLCFDIPVSSVSKLLGKTLVSISVVLLTDLLISR